MTRKANKLTRKNKPTKVKKYSDITRLSMRSQLNYALVTSEYQSFLQFFNIVKPLLIPNSTLFNRMVARESVLEEDSRSELLLTFGMNTSKGELAETAIYDMDAELRQVMNNSYSKCVLDGSTDLDYAYLGLIATYRKASEIAYPNVSPIHLALSYAQSTNYNEQFEHYVATTAEGYVAKDDDVTLDDLRLMVATLCELTLTSYKDYPLLTTMVNLASTAADPKLNAGLAMMLLAEVTL